LCSNYSNPRYLCRYRPRDSTMPIERIQSGSRMSQAVVHNKVVYMAGQVATVSVNESVAAQTREILEKIDRLLAEANTDKSRVLSVTIWLTEMAAFSEMNAVWDAWIVPGSAPARATTMSPSLALPGLKIEIAVIAAQP
jgi:enamine deaminase RidA (YjgF/YER057c/UK114 family)